MHQIRFWFGLCPKPARSPDRLVGFKGADSKRRRGQEEREGERRREGKVKREIKIQL